MRLAIAELASDSTEVRMNIYRLDFGGAQCGMDRERLSDSNSAGGS